jgi:hypothetical protein
MNAARRFLIGAAVTAGVLGAAAGTLVSCRQDLSPDAQGGAAPDAKRKAGDARFGDGEYTFYFKNGKNAHGDCDGYSSELNGKTTIYEYYQSDINGWVKQLEAAGIEPEVYRTSKPRYCWARFDTALLSGTGIEERSIARTFGFSATRWMMEDEAYFRTKNSTGETRVNNTAYLYYARAHEAFNLHMWPEDYYDVDHKPAFLSIMGNQKARDTPAICLFFGGWKDDRCPYAAKGTDPLRKAGIRILEDWREIGILVLDASSIEWFAYDN